MGDTVHYDDLKWLSLAPKIWIKLAKLTPETGSYTVMIRAEPGGVLPHHRHVKSAEIYILKGKGDHPHAGHFEKGDYVSEHEGARHDPLVFEVETEMLMISEGAIPVLLSRIMVHVVAVAGGQGDVGKTIVEVLSQNQRNRVLVLSRKLVHNGSVSKSCANLVKKLDDEPTIYVDYTDVSHIRDALEKHNVEVVISCLNVTSPEASQAELANGPFQHPKVDMANKAAAVPGSGEGKVVSTYSFDVTRFVDSLLNADEEWPKQSVIIGEKITTNEINAISKDRYVGERFSVVHDDVYK
ncbi:cupin conserved barrel [Fusarium globosum]|uniref:Cupin conserved barrel n=1 Tax=Fusarium globosum TaxID=78864 RepID=A0A8H6CZ46_9HYPO|nr:cupin conserved barrel [Fusarium globosum]